MGKGEYNHIGIEQRRVIEAGLNGRDTLELLILALVEADSHGLKRDVFKIIKPKGAILFPELFLSSSGDGSLPPSAWYSQGMSRYPRPL
ncbi:MAG: hypothetical protein IJI68_09770 [Eggerthellaceae bacterium]|nr:hypothetical protein [Eggerthellaceae bacterium]